METAGHALGIRVVTDDENGFRPGLMDPGIEDGVADGPEQIRAAVRFQIRYGADVIKTCATGGVSPKATQLARRSTALKS